LDRPSNEANKFVNERKNTMIDSRKTGAYISKLRKEKDWTQLDLADRLHVTPQAVSRWETGDSFPDLSLLVDIGKTFRVSVDDLLNGEPVSSSRVDVGRRTRWGSFQEEPEQNNLADRKATTGEVLTELAQGQTEQVARLVSEGKADLESVIEAGPLARPSAMNEVVSRLTGYAFSLEQIVELAPFISQDLLSAIVDQAIEENVDLNFVSDLAPFLNRETLDSLVDRAVAGEIDGSVLVGLAPFLSREKLDSLVGMLKAGTLDQSHLEELAPFLSAETLERLLLEETDGKVDLEMLESLAPFLSKDTLDRLVEQVLVEPNWEGTVDARYITSIAPFLRQSTLQKLLQLVETGSIPPDVIVELAPFLDKESLTALIRGVSASNAQRQQDE
jgi:transcriptional regulator with XRE-family HTH domain